MNLAARSLLALCLALLLGACESLFTGETVANVPLEADADGGFKPVTFDLSADMSPVALNFHAELGNRPDESGKWNRYRATLRRAGQTVASAEFSINYTGTPDLPPANPSHVATMLVLRAAEGGQHELSIRPLKAGEVTLQNVRLEVRRNVQLPR
jgi:hypothetical protein